MKKRTLLINVFSVVASLTFAQNNIATHKLNNLNSESNEFVKKYTDSLIAVRKNTYVSRRQQIDYKKLSIEDAQLFLPVTYNRELLHNDFALDGYLQNVSPLRRVYLENPKLVRFTDKELQNQQAKKVEVDKPIKHELNVLDKIVPTQLPNDTAAVELMVMKPNFWSYKGEYSLQVLQNYVSENWYKGGESNYSALASVLMEANYNNKQKIKWDNRLEMKLGMLSSRSDSLHSYKTTEDLIRLTSKFGLQATKKWYYTFQVVGYSQFMRSFKANDPIVYANFLAPFNLNVSIGMDYTIDWMNHKLKGNIHLAPLAYNMKYTKYLDLSERLGIETGRHTRHSLGSEVTIDFEWQLMDMLKWKSRLYGYTTFSRAEFEWENTFMLQFNKYIGAQLFIFPRFDDGVTRGKQRGYWQLKEFASIGFQLSLATKK